MATNFPTSKDDGTSLPNPAGTDKQNSPDHGSLHTNENAAIIALESKVGTGASTPVNNTFLFGTGTGTSAWTTATSAQVAAAVSDETGTGLLVFGTTPTLVTPKIDTINEATLNNGTTIGGVNIKGGFMSGTNLTAGTVGSSQLATGVPVQIVSTNYSAVATGTTLIPYDDTMPQITEGTEFMTQAIIPKSATNRLYIEATFYGSYSVVNDIIGALFQDSTANSLAAISTTIAGSNYLGQLNIRYDMLAATTSSTTFRIRAGGPVAGTITFNGQSGARRFGGATISNIKITEYKA